MTPNQADFQNLMGILLSTVTYLVKKKFIKIDRFFLEIKAKLWKNALYRNVEESFYEILD